MLVAALGGKLVFCLSGNPCRRRYALEQYAIPALLRAAGRREGELHPRPQRLHLTNGFLNPARATATCGRLPAAARWPARRGQHRGTLLRCALSAMMGCNCSVEIPAGSGPVEPGTEVEVLCFVQ